jgi:hypothetical protein
MRNYLLRPATALIALILTAMLTGGISQADATLIVNPTTVSPGDVVSVSGTCDPNSSGFIISQAFTIDSEHEFAGQGAIPFVTDAFGNFSGVTTVSDNVAAADYDVTGRCGGGNIGVIVTLTVTNADFVSASDQGDPSWMWKFAITIVVLAGVYLVVRELYKRR